MAYKKKTYRFQQAMEVQEYHTGRYGAPGQGRQKKKKPTKEEMEKVNQYNKERRARHRLWKYFKINDYFADLTYSVEERPASMKAAKAQFSTFLRKVRREYKKRGEDLKWMRNIEVGTKNAWHIHLIVNRIPDTDLILRQAWGHGKATYQLLYEKGDFIKLAAYITKSPKTDSRLKESDFDSSRNMPLPKAEEKVYKRWKSWHKIKIPKGWYLDEGSFYEGINPKTGLLCRRYILLRIKEKGNETGKDDKHHKGRDAEDKKDGS